MFCVSFRLPLEVAFITDNDSTKKQLNIETETTKNTNKRLNDEKNCDESELKMQRIS